MNVVEATKKEAHRGAKLVSNILHPWAVLVPVLALAAYQAAGEPLEYLKWTLLAFVPALVSPLIYARVRVAVLSRGGSQQKISRSLGSRTDQGRSLYFVKTLINQILSHSKGKFMPQPDIPLHRK